MHTLIHRCIRMRVWEKSGKEEKREKTNNDEVKLLSNHSSNNIHIKLLHKKVVFQFSLENYLRIK